MLLYTDPNLSVSVRRKWPCKICFMESFDRRQELDRHIKLMHLPCCVFCQYSPCEWRGCRVDELQRHLNQMRCNENSLEREYSIYDVESILDMIRSAESNDSIRNAQNWAVRFVQDSGSIGEEWMVRGPLGAAGSDLSADAEALKNGGVPS